MRQVYRCRGLPSQFASQAGFPERHKGYQETRREEVKVAPEEGDWQQINGGEKLMWIGEGPLPECVSNATVEQACVEGPLPECVSSVNVEQTCVQKEARVEYC